MIRTLRTRNPPRRRLQHRDTPSCAAMMAHVLVYPSALAAIPAQGQSDARTSQSVRNIGRQSKGQRPHAPQPPRSAGQAHDCRITNNPPTQESGKEQGRHQEQRGKEELKEEFRLPIPLQSHKRIRHQEQRPMRRSRLEAVGREERGQRQNRRVQALKAILADCQCPLEGVRPVTGGPDFSAIFVEDSQGQRCALRERLPTTMPMYPPSRSPAITSIS